MANNLRPTHLLMAVEAATAGQPADILRLQNIARTVKSALQQCNAKNCTMLNEALYQVDVTHGLDTFVQLYIALQSQGVAVRILFFDQEPSWVFPEENH
ncbi:hypothetical protein [Thiothrix winogradskyi]|uniref:Uncharacterized protein n=1 Tax=Thiothrix winogradskyi TaxID=96472 RepID=A0ABY3T3R6_9GAMM|nr:hypothetical protein [Thiothrix winogradskyi]UJS26254.1 hypothetical protein L2Y54_09505 [Thiothrix winogradskyi]